MTDHINDKYIKVTLSMLVYVVRGLLEWAPQVVFETDLTCLIITIIYGFRSGLLIVNYRLPSVMTLFSPLHQRSEDTQQILNYALNGIS